MVKLHHRLENHPTMNLTYDINCTLLLDCNKQQFHSKESLTQLSSKFFNARLRNTCATVHQGTGYPSKQPHGGLKF